MVRITITGHTRGIGNAILVHNLRLGNDVVGFSRSTGHDLGSPGDISRIVAEAEGSDVFINNAYHGFAQVDLLYAMHAMYANTNLLIISIGSNSSDGIKNKAWPYSVHKSALDKASEQLSYLRTKCKVSNLRLGWVDVQRTSSVADRKLTTDSVCMAVDHIIQQWVIGHHVRELTLLP